MRIDVTKLNGWHVAKKLRPIKAKPLINLLVDRSVINKFLIDSLEGIEPLGDGVVICIGESGDIWQQTPKKLHTKYDITAIDNDGWMVCTPKPDNSVNVIEITMNHTNDTFTIIGHWGANVDGELNVQRGEVGDFICQNISDISDVWIVKRKIFLNTYKIIS